MKTPTCKTKFGKFELWSEILLVKAPIKMWIGSAAFEDELEFPEFNLETSLISGIKNHVNDVGEIDKVAAENIDRLCMKLKKVVSKYRRVDLA